MKLVSLVLPVRSLGSENARASPRRSGSGLWKIIDIGLDAGNAVDGPNALAAVAGVRTRARFQDGSSNGAKRNCISALSGK